MVYSVFYYWFIDWCLEVLSMKRFTVDDGLEDVLCWEINDKENDDMTCGECAKLLNELTEENEQLKKAYAQLKHRHSLLHDVCIDAECDRDSYRKDIASLEKENEQLKKQLESEHTMLDNAILLERTRMGKNCLKQFRDAIQ